MIKIYILLDELLYYFRKFGPIDECTIMLDKNTGITRG